MTPRWRKVLRDVWANKTRTIIVLLSIAVGVTAIGMVMGSQLIIDRDLPADYAAVNPASGTIFALNTFDDDMIDAIRAMPEVEAAEGRRFVIVRFLGNDGEWHNLQLFAIPNFDDITINKLKPQLGEFPPDERHILLERSDLFPAAAAALGFAGVALDDLLTIEPPDGRQREIKVSGTVHDLSQLPTFLAGNGYGYITYDTLEWLGEPRDYNQVVYVVKENKFDQEHVQAVGKLITDRLERSGVNVIFNLVFSPGEHPAQNFLNAFSYVLGAVGLLALGLSSFLIINILSAILTQQVRQIGIMKAIGARTSQVTGMYFVLVFVFGLMAVLIAIPLGAIGATLLANVFANLLNFDVGGFALDPTVVLVQLAIGLTVPLLAAIFPIVRGVRVTVREAVNTEQGLGKGQFGTSILDRFILGLRRVIPMQRPAQISLRNTFRRKGRLMLTLLTLSLASAIFISILSVRASLLQTLDDALTYFDYDVQVQFSRPYRTERIQRAVAETPGVEVVETWGFASTRRIRPDSSESDTIILYAPTADTGMLNPTLINGRWLQPDDTNAVVLNTDVLRNEDDITVGSPIVLEINGRNQTFVVVGLVRGVLTGPNAFVNFDYFSRITKQADRAQISLVRLSDRSAASQGKMAPVLENLYRDGGFRVEVTQTISQVRTIISTIFNVIIGFLLAMAVLLGVVGGLGLMGTMSINVLERTREIGVMRAIGASDGAVLRIVLLEGIIIGLISWVIGGLIALPVSRILTDTVGNLLLQAAPTFVFATAGAGIWLLIILLLALVASFLPARGASRLTIREVLAYE
jgi:putative ABC transport system permease protein